jgi:hypothetical protein
MFTVTIGSAKWLLDDCFKSTFPGTYAVITFLAQNTPL